jgi:hypothetical protein
MMEILTSPPTNYVSACRRESNRQQLVLMACSMVEGIAKRTPHAVLVGVRPELDTKHATTLTLQSAVIVCFVLGNFVLIAALKNKFRYRYQGPM